MKAPHAGLSHRPLIGPLIQVSNAGPSCRPLIQVSNAGSSYRPQIQVSNAGPSHMLLIPVSNAGHSHRPLIQISHTGILYRSLMQTPHTGLYRISLIQSLLQASLTPRSCKLLRQVPHVDLSYRASQKFLKYTCHTVNLDMIFIQTNHTSIRP